MDSLKIDHKDIVTIERFILSQQLHYPKATGVLTSLLYDLAVAGKLIASKTTRAGLSEILGETDQINVQGERVMKLDVIADETIYRLNYHTGRLAAMASEEHEGIIPIPSPHAQGKYVLLFDPLDGSTNVDFNVPVGTIFAIYRRKSPSGPGRLSDCLQPGRDILVAGYILFGPSTMLVYTDGQGVHGFTLDRTVGEFLLSHPMITIPSEPQYFSCNMGNEKYWSPGVTAYTRYLQGLDAEHPRTPLSSRYIGSLVADFHRNLLSGGVFYYPPDSKDEKKANGKLRLLYEANPLAFIAQQAGGYASNGSMNILDIQPTSLHERTPLFVGNADLVRKAEEFLVCR